jgi:hypothetical protein
VRGWPRIACLFRRRVLLLGDMRLRRMHLLRVMTYYWLPIVVSHIVRLAPAPGRTVRFTNARHGRNGRASMIHRSEISPILTGGLLMRELVRRGLKMLFMGERTLLRSRPFTHAARAVEAGPIVHYVGVIDYRSIDIGIVDHCRIHVHNGSVVAKRVP